MNQEKLNRKLWEGSLNGDILLVRMVLKLGADVHSKDKDGDTSLYLAVCWGYTKIAKLIIDYGADVNAKNKNGHTPLHLASFHDYFDVVTLLLEKNADVNVQNNKGNTPLNYAISWGSTKMASFLKRHGAITGNEIERILPIFN